MAIARGVVGALRAPGVAWSFSRLGYRHRARRFSDGDIPASLAGLHFAVSGANGGIGYAIAKAFASRHADVTLLCRNHERGEATRTELDAVGAGRIELVVADMAEPESIDRCLREFPPGRLDGLIHNAGALVHEYQRCSSGLELTFSCHVVGPRRLTLGLRSRLVQSPSPRVVLVSSGGMYAERLSVDALLHPAEPFDGVRAYARAKRAQVVLAERWARESEDIRFFAMHPGWVDTPGVRTALPRFYRGTKRWLRAPHEGADTAVWLAACTSLEVQSGSFVFDRSVAPRHILPGTRSPESEHQKLALAVDQFATAPPG